MATELCCNEVVSDSVKIHEDFPFKDFDCEGWTMKEMIKGTYEIYTPEQEKEWGTLAIKLNY